MSENILNQNIVLVLNSLYVPIGYTSVRQAVVAMCSSKDGENMAADALDLDYEVENGTLNWMTPSKMISTTWNDWVNLPIRDKPYCDEALHSARITIRVPIVIRSKNFSKMVYRKLRPNKKNLYHLYNGQCIWTGKILSLNQATVEHLHPKSHGGKESFSNLALADKKINNDRGNIPLSEWTKKYKPHYNTKEPIARPVCNLLTEAKRPEWLYFLIRK